MCLRALRLLFFSQNSHNLYRTVSKRCLTKVVLNANTTKPIPLSESTLMGKIILYLNANKDNIVKQHSDNVGILNSIKNDHTDRLQYLSTEELIDIFHLLVARESVDNKWEFLKVLNVLDMECCARLSTLKPESIFKILSAYVQVAPNLITNYKFYKTSINTLNASLEKFSKEQLVEMFFYVSLQKKTREAQVITRNCLDNLTTNIIKDLNVDEMCIICNSTFKTSTRINNTLFLNKIKQYINDNLNVLKDTAVFVAMIKTLRQHRYEDSNLLSSISYAIFFNKTAQYYNFGAICHILALYSESLYYDENLLQLFYSRCMSELKDLSIRRNRTHVTEYIRGKDIKRFLWAISNLGYKNIEYDVFETVIEPKVWQKIDSGEFKKEPESIIEIVLYLWMLNYQAVNLIRYALKKDIVENIRGMKSKAKHRLNLLLSCVYFENRQLYKELNVKPVGGDGFDLHLDLQKRPAIGRILENLKFVSTQIDVNKFVANYQVPYLNIVGITGFKKNVYKAVNIEVLDSYICVKNYKRCQPSGPMQLKLRILGSFEEALLVIKEDEIESMTESALQKFLIDELKFVCE